jgi:hypothetical protein
VRSAEATPRSTLMRHQKNFGRGWSVRDRVLGCAGLASSVGPDRIPLGTRSCADRGGAAHVVLTPIRRRALSVADKPDISGLGRYAKQAMDQPVPVRVIARRPDTIVGLGETRIHAETATFEVRATEVASPRPGDQLTVESGTFVVQGEPERRDPDRLVWTLDMRPV